MQKSTKAALAALTGAGLLLGGAGSLAYWADDEGLPATTITTGSLDLLTDDCGDGWAIGGSPVDLGTYLLVPGETLTRTCTFTLDLEGDALSADLTLAAPDAVTGTLAAELTYAATYSLDGATAVALDDAALGAVTEADDGKTLVVDYAVTLPFDGNEVTPGIDNDSNNGPEFGNGTLAATLDALTVTLTQTTP